MEDYVEDFVLEVNQATEGLVLDGAKKVLM